MMKWSAIASTATGTSHLQHNLPCQDAAEFQVILDGTTIIGAVADGAGSAKHSKQGAEIAIGTVIEFLSAQAELHLTCQEEAESLFKQLVALVINDLKQFAISERLLFEDLACTLIVFIATQEIYAAMQIGDGILVVRSKNQDYRLVFKPDKGEYHNVTTFITSPNAIAKMQIEFRTEPLCFLFAGTDGLENPSIVRAENHRPLTQFFAPFERQLLKSDTEQCQKEIDQFLISDNLNRLTDDDKGIVVCSRLISTDVFLAKQLAAKNPSSAQLKALPPTRRPIRRKRIKRVRLTVVQSCLIIGTVLVVILFLKPQRSALHQEDISKPLAQQSAFYTKSSQQADVPVTFSDRLFVWLQIPKSAITSETKVFELKVPNNFYAHYQLSSMQEQSTPLGSLPVGTYQFLEAKNSDQSDNRWVKVELYATKQ
ncbi:PP2C family serine/threonine-protein phosphatase [Leptolyngbya boryana CZ1]|uniref:PP2C family serine/threonine-protein phosphatase n=1 Tax=Leptolyngbya boryana CZ1 TaxID=3060204 RepID=A0AA96WTY4_LEPBY|nr:PP2C family serine/threonine-protein phosphatase [Leptolyngbya boryana]WNZ44119.1 PP2C family serine/threonine-protein phosphatase [Leptolyngbya boryana CZ1]